MLAEVSTYVVLARRQETPTTTTLSLEKIDGTILDYIPGQCLTVYFPDLSQTLGKQYSISSAPSEKIFSITVKAIGRFSERLCSLAAGDLMLASDPHGTFYPKHRDTVILLAGGMGVTPFRSIIVETLAKASATHISLFYSSKTLIDMPFADDLLRLSKQNPILTLERFVTNQSNVSSRGIKYRHMRLDDITNAYDLQNAEFLISGSLGFVLELKNMLIKAEVNRENILTEAYF